MYLQKIYSLVLDNGEEIELDTIEYWWINKSNELIISTTGEAEDEEVLFTALGGIQSFINIWIEYKKAGGELDG